MRPQVVLISGHLDSWDVGSGAMDDGAGVFIGWQALSAIAALPARPKRTVRLVLWCSEEMGGGSRQYWKDHGNETDKLSIVMESDSGAEDLRLLCPAGIRSPRNKQLDKTPTR